MSFIIRYFLQLANVFMCLHIITQGRLGGAHTYSCSTGFVRTLQPDPYVVERTLRTVATSQKCPHFIREMHHKSPPKVVVSCSRLNFSLISASVSVSMCQTSRTSLFHPPIGSFCHPWLSRIRRCCVFYNSKCQCRLI